MGPPLLELRDLSCTKDQEHVFEHVNLIVNEGDIVIVQGKSGSGKTTLLKCIAHLILYGGQTLYHGSAPKSYGIPEYRTKVQYVPQRTSLLPGTPNDFFKTVTSLNARKLRTTTTTNDNNNNNNRDVKEAIKAETAFKLDRATRLATKWGIDTTQLWDREWANLSGGEAQRIALAIAVGLDSAEILLLDEPTSALDPQTSSLVEQSLIDSVRSSENNLKAIIWVTHSEEQASRVGTRYVQITANGVEERLIPPV